ncbi:hypothetical protein I3843_05G068500 [Carya illinoinensis]|nr:hypothetical protein I3843_05G068500 [Carya illinoinensis]
MADSEAKSKEGNMKKNKKRKLSGPEEAEIPPKPQRIALSENRREQTDVERAEELEQRDPNQELIEEGSPWRNLQLILSLQKKELDLPKKLELASSFVKTRVAEKDSSADQDYEPVKLSRLVVFLNDWTQSVLISSEKKMRGDGQKPQDEVIETCLDFRCWEIFKFCLEESSRLQVPLNFSRNLLRPILYIAKDAVSLMNNTLSWSRKSVFIDARFKLYIAVLDCISLVFSSHDGLSNENLDLWMSTVDAVLELVFKFYTKNLDGDNMGDFALRFSCLVLEPFAMFLRAHPTRKTGFHDFIDKLLEPLMHLLAVLHLQIGGSNSHRTGNLLNLVEDVLSNGLFHPIHIDGFLSLHSAEKYATSHDGKSNNKKTVIKSYHRHLFDKLERTLTEKVSAMGSIGELFHLLVNRVKLLKKSSVLSSGTKMRGKAGASRHLEDNSLSHASKMSFDSSNVLKNNSYYSGSFNADIRKSLFDFFVQIMEPLLLKLSVYLQDKVEVETELSQVRGILQSINNLLASFMHEKIYVRTEDTSEGACLYFLKKVYDTVISSFTYLNRLSKFDLDNHRHIEMLTLSVNEVLVAVGYLLEIEYEVTGNDLVSLWLIVFSYSTIGLYLAGMLDQISLFSKIEALGCQLINLYGQLRQVNNCVFALCKALRLVISQADDGEINCTRFVADLPTEAYARSVGMLLCSQEFKCAIRNAIKSIPEGQASACIKQLAADVSETLGWMKVNCSVAKGKEVGKLKVDSVPNPPAELLGRGLSELYALVLDSVTVTTGNSNLLGVSIKDLMMLLQPCMNSLVAIQPDTINMFLSSVTGIIFDNRAVGSKCDLPKFGFPTCWIFIFFFQLYMSCRSLYRQAISLVPPDLSRKMSVVMGDSFTAYSGKEWMERTDLDDKGYFSWIFQPSATLDAVIQSVSNIYLQNSTEDCSPLIYVLHAMALQRLVDLNRQIKSLEYLQQSNDKLLENKLVDAAGLSLFRKRSRKWERHISVLRQEAAGLTDFIMGHLPLVAKDQQSISSDVATCLDTPTQAVHETEEWDFGISSVNKKSLPTALWWIVCQNIDIWCTHAAKKKLKMFLSILICTSIPSLTSNFLKVGKQCINESSQPKKVTMHQISSALLRDSILYEHKFVCRYFASRFCRVLEKSVSPLLRDFSSSNVDLNSSPHWPEVLGALDKSPVNISSKEHVTYDNLSDSKLIVHSSDKLPTKICRGKNALPSTSANFTACQSLLNLLCWMPKGYLNSRSLLLYATYLLNLERLVVGGLLECQGRLCSYSQYNLFRLFVSCRKALKYIIVEASEKKIVTSQSTQSLFTPIFPEDSFSALWLFKSVSAVVELQQAVSEDSTSQFNDLIFSLTDHTSYAFLTLSRYQFSHVVHLLLDAEKPSNEQSFSGNTNQQNDLIESDSCLDSTNCIEAWKSACLVAKILTEEMQCFVLSLKDALRGEKVGLVVNVVNLTRFSPIVSCFSGFLWGLVSAINDRAARYSDNRGKLLWWKCEPHSELNFCINVFEEFINLFLRMFLLDNQQHTNFYDAQNHKKSDYSPDLLDAEDISLKGAGACVEIASGIHQQKSGTAVTFPVLSDIHDDSASASVKRSWLKDANFAASILNEVDSFDSQCINKPLLHRLLNGDYPGAAFSLRQLLIASSALLRLKLQINMSSSFPSLVPIFVGISQVLLLEFVHMVEIPQPHSFVWLDGVLKYLEELGNYFPSTNPTLSRNMYAKLIELHLRAIGKCITLQGKRATLASHETESSTKTLPGHMGLSEASYSSAPYCLDEFKARLRMSFKTFIKKPSELHLLSAVQAIERALVGVQEECTMNYDITVGADGGKVSSLVAAGVDCFDLVLEFVSGRKRLSVVKRHIQSLIAGLFNIILHLQNPLIFYGRFMRSEGDSNLDPGSVILMCVEVLIRVSGKHALFQMDAWHVAASLRIPAALFQDFCQLKDSEAPSSSHPSLVLDNQVADPLASMNVCVVDRYFSIDLFAACCRLLYTILKHHKSECEQCIALLEASVSVLLRCLETVDTDPVTRKGYFSWDLEEGVKCACFLRRIYEEIRQQKDILGRHCSQFLSNYIWVFVGFGPSKAGIKREIDEALRPGIYALIDACSGDDLQYLHTVFGEGPCRTTLATLQHDYKLNFQYEGKV